MFHNVLCLKINNDKDTALFTQKQIKSKLYFMFYNIRKYLVCIVLSRTFVYVKFKKQIVMNKLDELDKYLIKNKFRCSVTSEGLCYLKEWSPLLGKRAKENNTAKVKTIVVVSEDAKYKVIIVIYGVYCSRSFNLEIFSEYQFKKDVVLLAEKLRKERDKHLDLYINQYK